MHLLYRRTCIFLLYFHSIHGSICRDSGVGGWAISFPEPIISLLMLDEIIWLWGSLKFPALWLVFKTTKKLTGQTQIKVQSSLLYSKKAIAYHRLSFNEMFATKPNLFRARFIAKRSSTDNRHFDFTRGCACVVSWLPWWKVQVLNFRY